LISSERSTLASLVLAFFCTHDPACGQRWPQCSKFAFLRHATIHDKSDAARSFIAPKPLGSVGYSGKTNSVKRRHPGAAPPPHGGLRRSLLPTRHPRWRWSRSRYTANTKQPLAKT
jgi:hypothetical protein